jgi:hypothetical protein
MVAGGARAAISNRSTVLVYKTAMAAAHATQGSWDTASNSRLDRAPAAPGAIADYHGHERREGTRVATRLAGKLISADGFLHPDCTVLDLSRNGARVHISAAIRLPPPAALLLVDEGLLFDAAVAWRRGNETGLVFTSRHDLRISEPRERPGLRKLWLSWTSV